MAMQDSDRFVASLFPANGPRLLDLKFFPGEEQEVTVSIFEEKAHAAFLSVDSGLSTGTDNFPESLNRVSVDKFLLGA
jgi:hypothetical protein